MDFLSFSLNFSFPPPFASPPDPSSPSSSSPMSPSSRSLSLSKFHALSRYLSLALSARALRFASSEPYRENSVQNPNRGISSSVNTNPINSEASVNLPTSNTVRPTPGSPPLPSPSPLPHLSSLVALPTTGLIYSLLFSEPKFGSQKFGSILFDSETSASLRDFVRVISGISVAAILSSAFADVANARALSADGNSVPQGSVQGGLSDTVIGKLDGVENADVAAYGDREVDPFSSLSSSDPLSSSPSFSDEGEATEPLSASPVPCPSSPLRVRKRDGSLSPHLSSPPALVIEPSTKTAFPLLLCGREEGVEGGKIGEREGCKVLAGVGVRSKSIAKIKSIKIYAFGLYVSPENLSTSVREKYAGIEPKELRTNESFYDDLISSDSEMTLRCVVHFKKLKKEQVKDAFVSSLRNRLMKMKGTPEDEGLPLFSEYFTHPVDIKRGTTIDFTRHRGGHFSAEIAGKKMKPIQSHYLCRAFFDLYIGTPPVCTKAKHEIGENIAKFIIASSPINPSPPGKGRGD